MREALQCSALNSFRRGTIIHFNSFLLLENKKLSFNILVLGAKRSCNWDFVRNAWLNVRPAIEARKAGRSVQFFLSPGW